MSAVHTNKTSRVDSPCNCVCNDTWRTSRDRNYQDIGFCRYRAWCLQESRTWFHRFTNYTCSNRGGSNHRSSCYVCGPIQIRQVEWIAPAIVSATILGVLVETGIIRISGFVGIGLLKQSTDLDEDQLIDTLVGDCDKIRDILLCHCEAEKMIILVTGSAAVGSYKYLGIVYNIRNMISSMIAESESDYTLCSYCHRIKPCRGPNNICTECINQMRVSASLD